MNLTNLNIYKIIELLHHFLSNQNSRVYSNLSVTVFTLCFSLFSYVEAWSQQGASALRPRGLTLKVGDALPDELQNVPLNVINHPEGKQTIKLVDYKNKVIIIDFWATWCLGCIAPLQKLDTIQRELADDVVIIPVTNDNQHKAEAFIKGRRWKLPTVVNNSILQEYFPHKYIPHYVWVNQEGRVEAITGPEAVNRKNIKAVIEGRNLDVPNKNDLLSFDFKKPLFIDGNGGSGTAIKYRSLFSEPIPGLFQTTSNVISDTINNTSRIYGINCRALLLYSLAYQKLQSFPKGCIVYEINDSAKLALFESSKDGRSSKKHLFTYELITPLNTSDKVRERVADDLEHFFGLSARFEKRLVDCYILKSLPTLKNTFSKGGERKHNLFFDQSVEKFMQNQTVDMLYGYLNELLPLAIVDETDYRGTLDLKFPQPDGHNLKPLQEALRIQGISLERGKREVEFFVISDH